MSTTSFESDIKRIHASQSSVYNKLSDISNLEKLAANVPTDKLKDVKIADGCLSFPTMMGEISMKVAELSPCESIKYSTVKSPIPFQLNIRLGRPSDSECNLQLEAELDMNPFMLKMAQKPVTDALNRIAEALTMINY